MKKHVFRIICIFFIVALLTLILINIPFRLTVDIDTYGVLARLNAGYEYEVRNVRIDGVLTRRIIRHGFGGGHFFGTLDIDGVDFLDGLDIENRLGVRVRPTYWASFFSTRGDEPGLFTLVYPSEFINFPHLNIHGFIGFSNSLNVFAIKIFEPNDDHQLKWYYENGLFLAAPAQSLSEAKAIYWAFFVD